LVVEIEAVSLCKDILLYEGLLFSVGRLVAVAGGAVAIRIAIPMSKMTNPDWYAKIAWLQLFFDIIA
jgi:hypothetical protein